MLSNGLCLSQSGVSSGLADLLLSASHLNRLGLLGGLYFALLYTTLGIPIARLAERKSRVNIITWSLIIWSGFTALCGAAQNFVMLAILRFGVGIGVFLQMMAEPGQPRPTEAESW